MTVHVVYIEENRSAEPEIVGVYATKERAQAAKDAQVKAYQSRGKAVWAVDNPETGEEEDDWDVDIHVEAFEVQGA